MPTFAYTAIESGTGRKCQGRVASANAWLAATELRTQGRAPISLLLESADVTSGHEFTRDAKAEQLGRKPFALRKKRLIRIGRVVSRKGLMFFTRQLATLLKAGMPLVRSLEVLARSENNLAFRAVIVGLADGIRAGGNLSDGLKSTDRIFDELYVTMIKTGEAGGALDAVLDRLARFLERSERIRGRVKAAMTYPLIIMFVAGGILTGLMVFVVPKFQQIFSGVLKGQPLPPLTLVVIGVGEFVHHHAGLGVGLAGLLVLAAHSIRRRRAGRYFTDWLLIKSPLIGDLFLKAVIGRFTRTFGSLLSSGVPMLEALTLTRQSSGNVHIAAALLVVHDRVKEGSTVTRALAVTAVFPGLVTSLIEVGEETGALAEMLGRIADAYDEEVDNAVAALTAIIEPIMIVLMALVVGVIVVALFLPIVGIVQHLQ